MVRKRRPKQSKQKHATDQSDLTQAKAMKILRQARDQESDTEYLLNLEHLQRITDQARDTFVDHDDK